MLKEAQKNIDIIVSRGITVYKALADPPTALLLVVPLKAQYSIPEQL